VVCLIDTDGNPELADIAIPGNDDSMRSIDVIIRELCKAIAEGKQQRTTESRDRDDQAGETDANSRSPPTHREASARSRRASSAPMTPRRHRRPHRGRVTTAGGRHRAGLEQLTTRVLDSRAQSPNHFTDHIDHCGAG
jgi:hypothetical protein